MTTRDAESIVMPFGKHKGRTLGQIADEDDGLLYLDWLLGEGIRNMRLNEAVTVICQARAATIDALLEGRER